MSDVQRILVVDDEPAICQNVQKILERNDYEVFQANSASQALEELGKRSYSLMISDIVMPETNGLELLKMVKNQWPLTKVLMMTAYASTDTAVKAIRLGAIDYLPKPFTPDELRKLIDDSLAGELLEAKVDEFERDDIDAAHLHVSLADMAAAEAEGEYCPVGDRMCKVFAKKHQTCKAGLKKGLCPIDAKKAAEAKAKGFDGKKLIGVDSPFSYEEVEAVTGPQYVENLNRSGFSFLPYEELKRSAASYEVKLKREQAKKGAAEMPFTYEEVEAGASAQYADTMDRNGLSFLPYGELKASSDNYLVKLNRDDAVVYEMEMAFAGDVLVIDDEVAVNNNIRKILSKSGYSIEQAVSKREALDKVSKGFYRMIILDLKMPGVVGLELLERIREMQPEAKIIIITGYASIETAVETSKLGAMEYVAKPFTPAEMRKAVEKAAKLAA